MFALVAGNLVCRPDVFETQSGKLVDIKVYTRSSDATKVDFAIESIKAAMRWDESRFGREYDLDVFNVVAVSDFNMGAMENKGLNALLAMFWPHPMLPPMPPMNASKPLLGMSTFITGRAIVSLAVTGSS